MSDPVICEHTECGNPAVYAVLHHAVPGYKKFVPNESPGQNGTIEIVPDVAVRVAAVCGDHLYETGSADTVGSGVVDYNYYAMLLALGEGLVAFNDQAEA